jgi:RNA polymerase sigma-70 factor (ECF subfamily)
MAEPSSLPDDLLIARIADGDRDAFAELYRRHRGVVYRFAAHMCGSASIAEDVVHEAFVAVIESARRYRPGRTEAKLWLLGIARNHARRAKAVRRTLSLQDEERAGASELTIECDLASDLDRQRHLISLRKAIVALPARYREVVVLCDLHELSYVDAAAAIGCAVGTVRSRLHRGRNILARRLCSADTSRTCTLPATRTMP